MMYHGNDTPSVIMCNLILYHGSEVEVLQPSLSHAKSNNDYGKGFYCTEDVELAKEWACKHENNGIVNKYSLSTDGLRILDLTDGTHTTLEWITLLINNRIFDIAPDSMADDSKDYLLDHHLIDLSDYDLIIGYGADDSYFSFAQSFLNNGITLESLTESMMLGNLGKQIVLISERAFDKLAFIGTEPADKDIYAKQFALRDSEARDMFKAIRKRVRSGSYIIDIMRGSENEIL